MLATDELALEFCAPAVAGCGTTLLLEGAGALVCATVTEDKSSPVQNASHNPPARNVAIVPLFRFNLIPLKI